MSKYGHSKNVYEDADAECVRLMTLLAIAHADLVSSARSADANPVVPEGGKNRDTSNSILHR